MRSSCPHPRHLRRERLCSTCHSYLDEVSFETAGEIDEDEAAVLDSLLDDEREPTSRLTCQIAWDEDLAGAKVRIGPF